MGASPVDRYAVIGNPVAHSRSPAIHAMFAEQTGERLSYERLLAPVLQFRETVERFLLSGGRGLNVTVPFKIEAYGYATTCAERASAVRAVNTLRFEPSGAFGDNTDGVGLTRDLLRLVGADGAALRGARVLVLGAGGAARGVLGALVALQPASILIANRDAAKAAPLVDLLADSGVPIGSCGLDALADERAELIINCTSAGLAGASLDLPAAVFQDAELIYDLAYGEGPAAASTPFLRATGVHGSALRSDGLGMLVEQAAESFFVWRGVFPDTAPVLAKLRGSHEARR